MPNYKASADFWINRFEMEEHPEGGYYKEIFRSKERVPGEGDEFPFGRHFGTSIYFLIPAGVKTKLHKIKSNEQWHHYYGSPVRLHCLSETERHEVIVGNPVENEFAQFFYNVSPGIWFGAECMDKEGYSLMGMTVNPGFEFEDMTMATEQDLLEALPKHQSFIEAYFSGDA